MVTLTVNPPFNYNAFFAAMRRRFPNWHGNVQIVHAARPTRDGGKVIRISINPLRGFRLPIDALTAAPAVLEEVS